jgi:hypothetical protein
VVAVDHHVCREPFTANSTPLPSTAPEISSPRHVATTVPEV